MSNPLDRNVQQALFERDRERLDVNDSVVRILAEVREASITKVELVALLTTVCPMFFETGYFAGMTAGVELAHDIVRKTLP